PPERDEAWSTNYDLWRVPVAGGKAENLTADNEAADGAPRFSPDGKWLSYRAQKTAGFEADRWQVYGVEVDEGGKGKGKPRSVTKDFDSSPEVPVWSADGKRIYFTADHEGRQPVYAANVATGTVTRELEGNSNSALSLSKDGKVLAFLRASLRHPNEVFVATL